MRRPQSPPAPGPGSSAEPPLQSAAVGRGGPGAAARRPGCRDRREQSPIDGYNQRRNDAIERIDEALLERLAAVVPDAGAWHSSETAGSVVDRLSILALKIFDMRAQATRATHPPSIAQRARASSRLVFQRLDLARCLDTPLDRVAKGARTGASRPPVQKDQPRVVFTRIPTAGKVGSD